MRKFAIAVAGMLVAVMAVPAHAADVKRPVLAYKAPPSPFSAPNSSGFYWGLGTSGGVAQSSVSGTNVFATGLITSSMYADGASVDGEVGWVGNVQNTWTRFALDGSYQNISAGVSSTGASASFASRWASTQRADVNAEIIQEAVALTGINLGNFPTFNPALPSNVKAGTPLQYLGFILHEEGLTGTIGTATGQDWLIAPGVETGWLWPLLNANGQPNGTALDIFAQVDWPTRGLEVHNLFATSGGPVLQSGNINVGTEYRVGMHLLLP